jgi:hypothetical protein
MVCRVEEGRQVRAPVTGMADGMAFVLAVDLDQGGRPAPVSRILTEQRANA